MGFNSGFKALNSWFLASWINVNKKVQLHATVCRNLFTAKSLYMFRVSQHPSSGALKTVTATSGIVHNTGTATSFQRVLIMTAYRFNWYVQTKFSAHLLGCVLLHIGTQLIKGITDEFYPRPDPHTAPDCEEIIASVYASDLYSRGAGFESRL